MKFLYENIFQYFLPRDTRKYFISYNFDFFSSNFLNRKEQLSEKIAKAIYFISYTYYLSYIRWIIRLKSEFKTHVNENLITKQEFLKFFSSAKTDKFYSLYAQAVCISSALDTDELELLKIHFKT